MKQIGLLTAMMLALTAAVWAALILNRRHEIWDRHMREGSKTIERSPYSAMIAETLVEIVEDSSMRHVFEDALEAETRLERQLARETGLEA